MDCIICVAVITTPRNHDDIRGLDDLLERIERLGPLYLGDNPAMAAGLLQELPRKVNIVGRARK